MVVGARHRHPAELERLAQQFQHRAAELRQLVQEQHALVGERDLARPGMRAAADHRRDRGRVVRVAKRPALGQAAVVEQPRDEAIMLTSRISAGSSGGNRPGRRARQHRLAGARRADQQQIVAAGGGDLERALGGLLALDVGQLGIVGRLLAQLRRRRRQDLACR